MRQLVEQQDLRAAGERGIEVELLQRMPAVIDPRARQHGEISDLRLRLGATVRLDEAHDHIGAAEQTAAALDQHLEGLARTRRRAEEDLQPPASFPLLKGDQRFRVGAAGMVAVGCCCAPCGAA